MRHSHARPMHQIIADVEAKNKSQHDAKPIVIRSACKCGNQLTEKELFYETCLQCGETPKQTDG